MANIETMTVKFVQYSNNRTPSEVIVQISSSKLIESSLKGSLFAPTVSSGSPKRVGQVYSLLRKLHRTENRMFLGFSRMPTPLKLGKNRSYFIAPALKLASLGKVGLPWTEWNPRNL